MPWAKTARAVRMTRRIGARRNALTRKVPIITSTSEDSQTGVIRNGMKRSIAWTRGARSATRRAVNTSATAHPVKISIHLAGLRSSVVGSIILVLVLPQRPAYPARFTAYR
jgi:hypothetical protein